MINLTIKRNLGNLITLDCNNVSCRRENAEILLQHKGKKDFRNSYSKKHTFIFNYKKDSK